MALGILTNKLYQFLVVKLANHYILFRLKVVKELKVLNDFQLKIIDEEIEIERERRRKNLSRKAKKVVENAKNI